ncbi:3'-5' exonuclease [Candidatus Vidania fulgoroideorum]
MPQNKYLIIDIETTGLNIDKGDRIIEIAYIYINNGKIKDIFNSLLKTKKNISLDSYKVHGIEKKMLSGKPKFSDISNKLIKLIKKCYLVAHNAKFDIKFLKNELNLIKKKITIKAIDTLRIAKKIFPGKKNSLKSLSKKIGIKTVRFHRAIDDVKILYDIFMFFKNKQFSIAGVS